MVDNIYKAINHAKEVAENWRSELVNCVSEEGRNNCLERAADHDQIATWLTELAERLEADKKLEESAEYYKDSFFGDGIRFALKVIGESKGRADPVSNKSDAPLRCASERWIISDDGRCICPNCGKGSFRYMFCPNCGALNRPESEAVNE